MQGWTVFVLLMVAVAACGEDPPVPPTDAGSAIFVEPVAPESPRMVCPPGWASSVDELGPSVCLPWPAGEAETCEGASGHFPGGPGCEPVGGPCPDGDAAFEPGLEGAPDTLFVLVGGTEPAPDGSFGRPFATVSQALAAATDGVTIALSRGEHAIEGPVSGNLAFRGACAAESVLVAADASPDPLFDVEAGTLTLRDLSVRAAGRPALRLRAEGQVEATGVLLSVSGARAALIEGGRLVGQDVIVRGAEGGIEMSAGEASFERLFVDEAGGPELEAHGLFHIRGGAVSLVDTFVRGARGDCVFMGGGSLTATRLVLEGSRSYGLRVRGAGAAVLEDVVVRRTTPGVAHHGPGLTARDGGRLTITRGLVEHVRAYGIYVKNGGWLEATDLVVRDVGSTADGGAQGIGISLNTDAEAQLSRVAVLRSHDSGVWCVRGSRAALQDVRIAGTRGEVRSSEAGYGMYAGTACDLALARAELLDNRYAGIAVTTAATVDLRDISVRDTRSQASTQTGGHGIHLNFGGVASIQRAVIFDNEEVGISAYGAESHLTLEDARVAGTLGRLTDGRFGGGISVTGATLVANRVWVDDNRHVGVYVGDAGEGSFSDLTVRRTRPQDCADERCAATPFGIGLGAFRRGAISVSDFDVQESSLCGVMVAPESDLLLRRGTVSGSLVGACVQASPFSLEQLTTDVSYFDNELNLDSTLLPVPDAAPPIED